MQNLLNEIRELSNQCKCGNPHNDMTIEEIAVGKQAIKNLLAFLQRKQYQKAMVVVDANTHQATGELLVSQLEQASIPFAICTILGDENGDVVADEQSLVQVCLETESSTDIMLAVGSGTIHDITRFCSAKLNIPFISVPTAPSVDGFTSLGAPLIVRGEKKTFQMTAPIALFADTELLKKAPKSMIAAGFGDMLAKITSLSDWEFDHYATGEPYCSLSAQLTKEALDECINNIEKIKQGKEEGIQILMESLIKSGLAMMLFGQSHPASGGEHHLSHYWEMHLLKQKQPQILHGAKVGVTTALLAEIYQKQFVHWLEKIEDIAEYAPSEEYAAIMNNIQQNKKQIITVYNNIPTRSEISRLLECVGGAIEPMQLGISNELVMDSLKEAHHLRNRFTALKFLNEVIKSDYAKVIV
ncbi:sn-glycerol-1-phosphate dehydrogenase [Niallia sp. NCCP-28]|uniref:sn-glycerol-1-phosphate dehydrogenase n=1 Tax=Niallia sp. NCCP-28 TaxID=2934712 RepID=UPI00208B1B6C|nr:sn-glycerol-1-phosphate dehydrogenase [Niallia sp. NCCP-28]GKU81912.1 glycerol-1-phosphate dehydrogenase [NAD(P)+] [Niallia sp. NCCP-28]